MGNERWRDEAEDGDGDGGRRAMRAGRLLALVARWLIVVLLDHLAG
jgi:hypothetical protein